VVGVTVDDLGGQCSASVVLPTFEERESVGPVIEALQRVPCVAEVVVVDDDSPDGTASYVRRQFDDVRVIVRPDGNALSTAVLRGFREARDDTEVLVCMDADGQHPPSRVRDLVSSVELGADVAVGSRHVAAGAIDADWPRLRYAMSLGGSLVAWAAVPASRATQDPLRGMFAARRPVVEAVDHRLDPEGHKILLEVLAQAPVDRVAEVPIEFAPRDAGESTTDASEVLRYCRHMGRLAVRARDRRRPTRLRSTREVAD
jgi:dolichol-phosphate mannosyltransferase